jgi:Subtilase family
VVTLRTGASPVSGIPVLIVVVSALGVMVNSCSYNDTLAPHAAQSVDSTLVPASSMKIGCTVLVLSITDGKGSVRVDSATRLSCGPVVPSLAAPPQYDATTRRLSLTMAIRNSGRLNLYPSTSLEIVRDSVAINGAPARTMTIQAVHPVSGDIAAATSARVSFAFDSALRSTSQTHMPVELKAGSISGVRVLALTLPLGATSIRLPMRASAQIRFTAALTAPGSTPEAELADSHLPANVIENDSVFAGRLVRNKLYVRFATTATIEDRQAALDAVDGVVVGGYHIGRFGYYYVRLPWAVGNDGRGLDSAMRVLWAQPGVARVIPHIFTEWRLLYQRPTDGSGYTSWVLDPTKATGKNWAPEAVSAPLAWGCSTGSTNTAVALVDSGFRKISDLSPNVGPDSSYQKAGVHATWVASVLAAQGNNGIGMAGMMWNAKLGFFFAFQPVTGVDSTLWPFFAIARVSASQTKYPVVNISLGSFPADYANIKAGNPSLADYQTAWAAGKSFQEAIAENNAFGDTALYVVASGNDSIDAFWSGFPAGKYDSGTTTLSSFARQILVVAASQKSSSPSGVLWPGSGNGTLVDLAAPGYDVYALNASSNLVSVTGTSFSAPMVSGLAGDLLAFNPSLGVDSLKSFIIHGAVDGGRTAGGYPIINAYASLRRAARLAGGPICSNRVFSPYTLDDNTYVQRNDSVSGNGSDDAILSGRYGLIIPHHGDTIYAEGDLSTWTATSGWKDGTGPEPAYAPEINLLNKQNHDGDSTAWVTLPPNDSGLTLTAAVWVASYVNGAKGDSCQIATVTHNADTLAAWQVGFSSMTRNLIVLLKQETNGQADSSANWYYKVPIPNTCPGTPATITAAKVIFHDDSLGSARFGYSDGDLEFYVEKTNPYVPNANPDIPIGQQSDNYYNPTSWAVQRQIIYSSNGYVQGVAGSAVVTRPRGGSTGGTVRNTEARRAHELWPPVAKVQTSKASE